MSVVIFLEGGGDKGVDIRCREGFRKLFEKAGFKGRMPQLVACGRRDEAFRRFRTHYVERKGGGGAMLLVDSEDPVPDAEQVWEHLNVRDPSWERPEAASDDQVLLMTTSMETWIVADREALRVFFGQSFREGDLPSNLNLEQVERKVMLQSLETASRFCSKRYTKGTMSFEILGRVSPAALKEKLSSFQRALRILNAKL